MTDLVGTFERPEEAERAVADLAEIGIGREHVTFLGTAKPSVAEAPVAEEKRPQAEATVTGMGVGAFAGGALGALVAVGTAAFPVIAPIVAAGALGAALAGGAVGAATGIAAGGLVGALIDTGMSREAAKRASTALEQGGSVLLVESEDEAAETVANVLRRNGASNIEDRPGPGVPTTIELDHREDALTPGTLR